MSRALSADGVSGSEFTLDIFPGSRIILIAGAVVGNEKDSGRPAKGALQSGRLSPGQMGNYFRNILLKSGRVGRDRLDNAPALFLRRPAAPLTSCYSWGAVNITRSYGL
jgi:hypothetical protein